MRNLFRKPETLPARIPTPDRQSHAFTAGMPTGDVKFFTILTDELDTPLAVGEVRPGKWEFIDGMLGTIATGTLGAMRTGVPTKGWTFVIGENGNARLLTKDVSHFNVPPFSAGDDIIFKNTLTMPTLPLPSWLQC